MPPLHPSSFPPPQTASIARCKNEGGRIFFLQVAGYAEASLSKKRRLICTCKGKHTLFFFNLCTYVLRKKKKALVSAILDQDFPLLLFSLFSPLRAKAISSPREEEKPVQKSAGAPPPLLLPHPTETEEKEGEGNHCSLASPRSLPEKLYGKGGRRKGKRKKVRDPPPPLLSRLSRLAFSFPPFFLAYV